MGRNDFVVHNCRNTKLPETDPNFCNNAFIDRDVTNVKMYPPTWKYCPECVAKGFQNPKTHTELVSSARLEALSRGREVLKENREKESNND
jgi:hypothetical protein